MTNYDKSQNYDNIGKTFYTFNQVFVFLFSFNFFFYFSFQL